MTPYPGTGSTIDLMRIGELATCAGAPTGQSRSYTQADLDQVQFIRQTQPLGFTLHETSHVGDAS